MALWPVFPKIQNLNLSLIEHEGDIYRGTFYFTKAWKGKPLEGYYIRAKDKKMKVKFIKD